jgi:hypothetical protein
MNDLLCVRGIERIGDLDGEWKRLAEFKRPSRDAFAQCFPFRATRVS